MSTSIPAGLIVSVSGIRGIVGESLGPAEAVRFGLAYGTYLRGGTVLTSRDGRPSGEMLLDAVVAGLKATGCDVLDIGICPTPTVGVAVREMQASGGIQITASHNPAPWNGLKLFGPDGAVLKPSEGLEVKRIFETGRFEQKIWNSLGSEDVSDAPPMLHIHKILQHVNVGTIAAGQFRVVVDGNGGSGGPVARQLLQQLGVEVVGIATEADGQFRHEAEPIPAHLTTIAPQVPRAGAAAGFVLDPDADRLALIDETGQCISEEATLALCVDFALKTRKGPVVVNMSTSKMNEDIARRHGVDFHRTAVGEANVVAGIRGYEAAIGGEGNGGVIDPAIGWVRDPFAGMAYILQHLAETRQTLSQLVAKLPRYAMLKTKFTVSPQNLMAALARLEAAHPDARVNKVDGLRLDWDHAWLHIRASNTEPIVRVIGEAPTEAEVAALCANAGKMLLA